MILNCCCCCSLSPCSPNRSADWVKSPHQCPSRLPTCKPSSPSVSSTRSPVSPARKDARARAQVFLPRDTHTDITLNLTDNFSPYPGMAGTVDILDQEMKHSAFMDIQQQAAAAGLGMSHHQAYSSLRSSYGANAQAQDAFANQQRTPLSSAYQFTMNNSPLHNSYSHPGAHPYLGSYAPPPPNVNSCAPCPPSPPRDSKNEPSKSPHPSVAWKGISLFSNVCLPFASFEL